MKKLISVVLCLIMVFGVFVIPASARTTNYINCEQAMVNAVSSYKSSLDVSGYNLHYTQIQDIFAKIYHYYPELMFYLSNDDSIINYNTGSGTATKVTFHYTKSKSVVTESKKLLDKVADSVLEQIDDNWTDMQKALYVHDWIAVNYHYDMDLYFDEGNEIHFMMDMMKNGRGVCQAYSQTFLYFMRKLGISVNMVMSITDNHSWDIIKLDGRWYHVDVTYDDPIINTNLNVDFDYLGRVQHDHFLLSNSEIIADGQHDNWFIPYETDEIVSAYYSYNGNSAFKDAVSAMIPMDDGYWYYVGCASNYQGLTRTKNFYNVDVIYNLNNFWYDSNGYKYNTYFTALYVLNGNLLFLDSEKLYVYDCETGNVNELWYITNTADGRFYGLDMDGEICTFLISKDAYGVGAHLESTHICNGNHLVEKWETVTEATMFQNGYRICYCDICLDVIREEYLDMLPVPKGAGDADGDGSVTVSDLAVEKLYLAGAYGKALSSGADFDKDSVINTADLSYIKLYLATR